jgi:hypothetical protein
MKRLARAALLAALAITLVAAGCGSDTKKNNDYVNAVNKAQTEFFNSVNTVQSGGSAQGADAIFKNLDAATKKVIADLKAVKPPDKVKDLHNQLVAQIGEFDTAINNAAKVAKTTDPQELLKAQTQLQQETSQVGTKITNTINEINKKLQD